MIPPLGQTQLDLISFFILLGVVQGLLLTVTGILRSSIGSKLKGLLYFTITCIIAEIFLNRTGYMSKAIWLVDFSEPLQFAIPPLSYWIVRKLDFTNPLKNAWLHFMPFFAYFLFFLPFYFAPLEYKQESYFYMHHMVDWHTNGNYHWYKTLGKFRTILLQANYLQITAYVVAGFQTLIHLKLKGGLTKKQLFDIHCWFGFNIAISILVLMVLIIKVIFFRDLGDFLIAIFFTLLLYTGTLIEILKPGYDPEISDSKVTGENSEQDISSALKEEKKTEIRDKLVLLMTKEKVYANNLISLNTVAKQIGEPSYLVSQVINEKMGRSFYDYVASLRVEEAKLLLSMPENHRFTIEEIAERVGYNSKSAFNKAFKKFTGQTPSEYRAS